MNNTGLDNIAANIEGFFQDDEAVNKLMNLSNAYASDSEIRFRGESEPIELLTEFGVPVSLESGVRIVQNTKEKFHFVIPLDPNTALSESELLWVAGGSGQKHPPLATAGTVPGTVSTLGSL